MEMKHAHCLATIQAEAWAARTLLVRLYAKAYGVDATALNAQVQQTVAQNTANIQAWLLSADDGAAPSHLHAIHEAIALAAPQKPTRKTKRP